MKNIIYTLLLAFVIFIGAGILLNYYSAPDDTLVIAFFGILATFIVIGNYSQVYNLTKNTDEKIKSFETKIQELNDKTINDLKPKSLKNEIQQIKSNLFTSGGKSQLSNIQTRLGMLEKRNTQKQENAFLYLPLNDILYLEVGEQKKLVRDILISDKKQVERNISIQGSRELRKAFLKWSPENGLIVEDAEGHTIDNVNQVASKPFDKLKLDKIIRNLINIGNSGLIQ